MLEEELSYLRRLSGYYNDEQVTLFFFVLTTLDVSVRSAE